MDRINEQLQQLQELTDEQISELEGSILSEFEQAENQDLTPQTVEMLEQLANAVEAVRAEQSRRVAEQEALNQKAAEAVAKVRGSEEEPEQQVQDGNPDQQAASRKPNTPEDEPPADGEVDDAVPADTPAPSPETPSNPEDEERKRRAREQQPSSGQGLPPRATASNDQPAEQQASVNEASTESRPEAEATTTPSEGEQPQGEEQEQPQPEPEQQPQEQQQPEQGQQSSEPAGGGENTTAEAPAEAENSNKTNPEAPVTAAAPGTGESLEIEPPADRRPLPKSTATMTITAGADIPGVSAGARFDNMDSVAEAFAKRLHSLRHVHGGDGEQHIVASIAHEFPDDRRLEPNDASENTDKIYKVASPNAITAAAGICLPLETRYDVDAELGVTDRPVRDALARFGADRGGIRYFTGPRLEDEMAATGFWRGDANGQNWATFTHTGAATVPANQKPCLEVQCAAEKTAYIEAITMCLTFNNLTTRVFPELIRRHNELALVAHARIAENHLLAQLEAGSTQITAPAQRVGAARELFNLIGRTVAGYRHRHRMSNVTPLRMVAPSWLMDMLRADLALQMPGDGMENTLGLAEAQLNAWFRARNVNITWHLDGVGPAPVDTDTVAAGVQGGYFEFPTSVEFGLWAEGTWLYLDGGTLDLGVIRDSSLVATNQYKQFVETFEGVAKMGTESFWVTAPLRPTGAAAALVTT